MTLGQFLDQAKVWFGRLRPWALVIVSGFLLVLLVHKCNRLRDEHDRLARYEEADRLRDGGLIVGHETSQLKDEIKRMAAENEDLKEALKQAREQAPMKPMEVVKVVTKVLRVEGPPRPCPQPGPAQSESSNSAGSSPPTPDRSSSCVLATNDEAVIRVEQVELETRKGNKVLVGTASAWRVNPKPEGRLFGGPFDPVKTDLLVAEPERKPGWGVGVWAGLDRNGWALGPSVATPPWRFLGLEVEWIAAGGMGPGGAWQLGTGLLVRL